MTGQSHNRSTSRHGNTVTALRSHRSILLDCIRGLAILAVLIFHVAKLYNPAELGAFGQFMRVYGKLGVDVFFPLSGYLITSYLIKQSGKGSVRIFFQRRIFRILPLYLVGVTTFLVSGLILGSPDPLEHIWIPYLFLTGWFIFFYDISAVPYTITWSLSVEEFAYILFGIAAWISRKHMPLILLGICILSTALRIDLANPIVKGFDTFPPARLDSIAIGGLVAYFSLKKSPNKIALCILTIMAVTLPLNLMVPAFKNPLLFTNIALGTCFFIVVIEAWMKNWCFWPLPWLASIGFYSYFTYLFHVFNIHFLALVWERTLPGALPPFWALVLASLLFTHVQALLSFRYFEGPLINYGRRLEKQHAASPITATATKGQS